MLRSCELNMDIACIGLNRHNTHTDYCRLVWVLFSHNYVKERCDLPKVVI